LRCLGAGCGTRRPLRPGLGTLRPLLRASAGDRLPDRLVIDGGRSASLNGRLQGTWCAMHRGCWQDRFGLMPALRAQIVVLSPASPSFTTTVPAHQTQNPVPSPRRQWRAAASTIAFLPPLKTCPQRRSRRRVQGRSLSQPEPTERLPSAASVHSAADRGARLREQSSRLLVLRGVRDDALSTWLVVRGDRDGGLGAMDTADATWGSGRSDEHWGAAGGRHLRGTGCVGLGAKH
jgi:hypothetical protein